jgi:hypothetical protein
MLMWARYGCHKKHGMTCYIELVFLHPVGSVGHVVHSIASGARNINTLFNAWVELNQIQQKVHWDTLR